MEMVLILGAVFGGCAAIGALIAWTL